LAGNTAIAAKINNIENSTAIVRSLASAQINTSQSASSFNSESAYDGEYEKKANCKPLVLTFLL
jgi:hypothetical protein